jgi:hypothetical protein
MPTTAVKELVKSNMTCKTKDLLETLKFLKRAIPKSSIGKKYSCEITVTLNQVQFVIIGAKRSLYCNANGPAKVTLPLLHLYSIVKTINVLNTHISVGDGFLTVNDVSLYVWTCFFEDDTILRSIDLPINFSPADVMKLPELYTKEEIEFNNLSELHRRTYQTLTDDIKHVYARLKKYGFTPDEIETLIRNKVYNHNLKLKNHEQSN